MTDRGYTLLSVAVLAIIALGTYAHVEVFAQHAAQDKHCVQLAMPEVTAHAAYVYDIKSGQPIFAKNATAQLPLASLTKLVTALVVTQHLQESATVTIETNALTPEGDSGLFVGEAWDTQDLLDFTLMTSSNDGARALALAASSDSLDSFVEEMNTLAANAGAHQTFFLNETGLDVSSTTAGAYGSARDVAHLLVYAYRNGGDALFGSTQQASAFTSLSGFTHEVNHTTSVAGSIPGQLIVKTGYTDLAGGNLAVLTELLPGRPVAVVVLGASRETRESDVEALTQAARINVKRGTLCSTI